MRSIKLALAALAAAVLLPATAAAAPAVDRVFDLPGAPKQLALGPDGNIWITLDGLTDNIARVRPDGTVDRFTSTEIVSPIGIVAGPDGQLWVTESNAVAHFSPSDPTAARRVPIPGGLIPNRIVAGPDGALWTASNDRFVRITTGESVVTFLGTGLVSARGIAVGGDGNLYAADFGNRQVVGITTAGVPAGQFPLADNPQEIAAGPANQLAATIPSNVIARFTPPSRDVQNTDVPLTDPTGIVFAPDGAYWAANFPRDTLTRLTPDGTVTTLSGLPAGSGPRHLVVGNDGTLWVGLETTRQVARVTGVVAPPTTGGGGGGGTTPPPDTTAPTISNVVLPTSLRVGRSGTLALTLSKAATVRVRWERRLPGRRTARGRCVRPRRHARHGRRCTRLKLLGTQTRAGLAGANRLRIGGRIGRRTIPAGRYRLTITATDAAGNASNAIRRTLTVTSRRRAARRP